MRKTTRRDTKSTTALVIGAAVAVALTIAVGFMVVRARTPVQEASAPSLGPAVRLSAQSTEELPPAPDVEVVMDQGEAAVGGSKIRLSQLWRKGIFKRYTGMLTRGQMNMLVDELLKASGIS